MKIRQGFVSNSSSSSFLVMFPKEMKSKEEVHNALFPNGKEFSISSYNWQGDDFIYSSEQISNQVWSDIKNQDPNDILLAIYNLYLTLSNLIYKEFIFHFMKRKINYSSFSPSCQLK